MPGSFSPFTPVSRATYFYNTNKSFLVPPTIVPLNNCSNTLCYTYNHNYIYQPHTGYGKIGTTAAGYLASRKRL